MSADPEREAKARLEAMRKRLGAELREGLGRVNRLEEPIGESAASLERMIESEYERFGGVAPDLEEG